MAIIPNKMFFPTLLIFGMIGDVYSRGPVYTPPDVERLTDRFGRISVNKSYDVLFGGSNIHVMNNGTSVDLNLNKSSGSGLMSKNKYYYGFFNAALKLPVGFTSGVVVAYYYTYNFKTKCRFLVDNIPVREIIHTNVIASAYPSKPMSVYTTIWDGSEWATHGGKYGVNYQYSPFVASMKGIEMEGCIVNQRDKALSCSMSRLSSLDPVDGEQFSKLSSQQTTGLQWARRKHMFYSYCQDKSRYKVVPQECTTN
ncbi:hypothetical protein ACS0TY_009016 [Phlomoides rotata]